MLPPQLRQVIELRFDHQNPRGDAQVARLLNGSVDEVREWTSITGQILSRLNCRNMIPLLRNS
jgi:hypothetical protein